MAVEYLYKDKKPVAEVWRRGIKMDTGTIVALSGVVVLAFITVGYAWWQMTKPAARLQMPCHSGVITW